MRQSNICAAISGYVQIWFERNDPTCWLTVSRALQFGCTKNRVCCAVRPLVLEAAASWLASGKKAGSRKSDREGSADVLSTKPSWLSTESSAAAAAVIWPPSAETLAFAALRAPLCDTCRRPCMLSLSALHRTHVRPGQVQQMVLERSSLRQMICRTPSII